MPPRLYAAHSYCFVGALALRVLPSLLRVSRGRKLATLPATSALGRHSNTATFQRCVDICNFVPAAIAGNLVPLEVGGVVVGEVFADTAALLGARHGDVFRFHGEGPPSRLTLTPALEAATPDARTAAVATVCAALREAGLVRGWRNELVHAAAAFGAPPLFKVERCCYPLLGLTGYGAHVNGFVRDPTAPGGLLLWVATRSKTKPTWPGLRDHIVAGHISEGLTPTATVTKECAEEAGIPENLARRARCAGAVSYRGVDEAGKVKRDVLFCYDLELPRHFSPTAVDGEVEAFELMDLDQVVALLDATARHYLAARVGDGGGGRGEAAVTPFKPNVALVVVDFLLRHGVISPDDNPGYLPLLRSLRSVSCA